MAIAHKIAEVCIWGTSSAGTHATGKILSIEKKDTTKLFEQTDENDELDALILHDAREEITVEVLATASSVRPAHGATLTISAVDYFVTESEDKWALATTKKISISAFRAISL